jgi:hypothetical protein
MLSRIDDIIFPDRCEVIEIEASQRYIYPIFKNGSTSLIEHAKHQGCKVLLNEQIKRIPTIDVILRDPITRFISGINTFVCHTKQENPNLDVETIIYFAENYLFLNRHYAPQLSWLVNLRRYLHANAKLRLYDMTALSTFTPLTINPIEENLLNIQVVERLKTNIHNEMYIRLDSLLLQLVGSEMTFIDIMTYLHEQDPIAYSKLSCIALD